MSEISDFIFEANKNIFKKILEEKCKEYEPEFVKKIMIYEYNKLMGIVIYFDWENIRYILEGHYLGLNKFVFFKNWRNLFRDKNINIFKSTIQKSNTKIVKFYSKMKFKIIAQDEFNLYLEYRR